MIFKCLFLTLSFSGLVTSLTVQTDSGMLEGKVYKTVEGKEVFAFLGIPYAKPPIGKYRFKEPQPPDSWKGVWPAHEFGSKCIQFVYYSSKSDPIVGEENCLYLNIFTPTLSNHSKLDVIFYIHGGGFMFGSSDAFLPDYILHRHDVVFVSINYRLGPFGFLSTEDDVVPGNNGMKDQTFALKWVQKNIDQFGGDRNKVTIAGLSAGGASVHLHYLSPLSRNLFQKGISMSGSSFCPWVLAENSREKAKTLANSVGCPTDTSENLVDCLQTRSAQQLLFQTGRLFMVWLYNPFSPFGVVIENRNEGSFLSENPYNLVKQGRVKDAPWLTSITSEEGLFPAAFFITNETLLQELEHKWIEIAPHLLDYNNTIFPEDITAVSNKIKNFYLKGVKLSIEVRNKLINMMSDRLFSVDIERSARLQAAINKSPVYFYNFSYRGNHSYTDFLCKCNEKLGASHADDLLYVLKQELFPIVTEEDIDMVNTMVNLWVSFAKTGKPTTGSSSDWTPVSRTIVDNGELSYLQISSSKDIKQMSSLGFSNRQFWDKMPFQELWNVENKDKHDEL